MQEWLNDNAKGTAQKGIYLKKLSSSNLLIAPLPEQRRIVAKIDSLSAKVGRARVHLDHLPRLVQKYKQAVLTAAFRGDLTGQWRANAGISNERREFSSATLEYSEFPSTWRVCPISEILNNFDGARVPVRATDRALRRGNYPYYGASGAIDTIDDFLFDGDYLLLGEDGANLLSRSTPIAFLVSGRFWVNNHAHILRAKEITSNAWVCWFINSINLVPFVTGSAQPKLTQAAMNRIDVPIPSRAEQFEIIRRIETAIDWIDRLASNATSARGLIDHLDQAVLAKAFRGELVPQDPSDEPASVLLERVRAERATPQRSTGARGRPKRTA